MEAVKYICEFFFCNYLHFAELLLLAVAIGGSKVININNKKVDSHE